MQIDAIKLFCDVAQHRSVSKAAEANGVTQSAVSQRLAALERELGVQLIDRSKRPLQLTEAGETYHHGCRAILDRYAKLTRQITGAQNDLKGTVRVAAIYSAGIELLAQAIDQFEQQHPSADVEVQYHQPESVYERVRDDLVDIGILSYPERWKGLATVALREEQMVVVCAPDHPLAGRESIMADELKDTHLVSFDPSLPIARRISGYLREHGVGASFSHTFDNIDTMKVYVSHSDEAAILPDRTVRPEVAAGTLAAIRLEPLLTRPIGVVYNRQRPLTPLVQTFIDQLAESTSNIGSAKDRTAVANA